MTWRTRDLLGVAAVAGAVPTVTVALDPNVRLAFESAETRVALETAHGLIAALGAYLLFGRFRRRRLATNLLLVYALGLLAAIELGLAVLPDASGSPAMPDLQAWWAVVLRVVAMSAVAVAALTGTRTVQRLDRPGRLVSAAVGATIFAAGFAVAALAGVLPAGARVVAQTVGTPELDGHPAYLGGHVVMAALAFAASVGFTRRARPGDPLLSALAVGSLLAGFSFLCFALYPSADSEIIQSGDLLRLGSFLVLLVGAEREIDRYWGQLAGVAVYEERRRLARDLHDGLAQELAYIVGQARLLGRGQAPPGTDERLAAAAERALDESRRAITALTTTADEPLHLAIARAAEDVAGRVGVEVDVQASPHPNVSADLREALVRIVRESVTNAARHGGATRVSVRLSDDGELQVVDDGSGFTAETTTPGRFGLVSMKERAERLGAGFSVESKPGAGTRVRVSLP